MLEGELDAHLGYDKHDKSVKTNRNGFHPKK
jgi:transposase-like protein